MAARVLWFCAALLAALPAMAQQSVDPRLATPMLKALQAEMALRDAALQAMQEDATKREKDLAEWFRGWFGAAASDTAK